MLLPEIATFAADHGLGTIATDIFYGFLPPSPYACLTFYEYGGLPNEPNPEGTTRIEYPRFQAVARGDVDDYDGPRLKLQQFVDAVMLIGSGQVSNILSGTRYLAIEPLQPPFFDKRDENRCVYIKCNFQVYKDISCG